MTARQLRLPLEILLVEDSKVDVLLTRKCLKEAKLPHHLHVVNDGVEAMQYLRREGKFADATRPDLVLLDLNMPRKDGFDVLAEVKGDTDLRRIPVVILTTSDDQKDIDRAYTAYANSYITKPVSFEEFVDEVAMGIKEYWFRVVQLPTLD